MQSTGIIRRIDDLGRIKIPKNIRKLVFGKENAEGMPMEFFVNDKDIILRRYTATEVCKWKRNSVFPTQIINPHVAERENISTAKYCPCCGKEIQVID